MSFRLDYTEPISKVVERLGSEHNEFQVKLERIVAELKSGISRSPSAFCTLIKPGILRHAVEEEARLVRTVHGGI